MVPVFEKMVLGDPSPLPPIPQTRHNLPLEINLVLMMMNFTVSGEPGVTHKTISLGTSFSARLVGRGLGNIESLCQ
jgi:hypothetical protein